MAIKRSRVNYLTIILTGGILSVFSIYFFLKTLHAIYGAFGINDFSILNLFNEKPTQVAILYSKYSSQNDTNYTKWLEVNIETWKRYLSYNKVKPKIIYDSDVEKGELSKYKLIILPGVKAVSDAEMFELRKYVENGGSIWATGAVCTMNEKKEWRGWDFVMTVLGSNYTHEITPEKSKNKLHTLRGNTPLTAGIPAGYPLKLSIVDNPVCLEVVEPRVNQASTWYNYRYEDGLVEEGIKKNAGIIYGYYGNGRFVWFGFEITNVIGESEDYGQFEKLFKNSLNWLSYYPISYVKDWPQNYQAAAIQTIKLDDSLSNFYNIYNFCKANNFSPTFLVNQYVLNKYPKQVAQLLNIGNIVPVVDIGYEFDNNEKKYKPYSYSKQYEIIKNIKDLIKNKYGIEINGISIEKGKFNNKTLEALYELNLKYLITDSLTDRSLPFAVYFKKTPILVFTKTARDDYEIIKNYNLYDPEFQLYTYEEDVDRIIFEGGLFLLKNHTSYQLKNEYCNVIPQLFDYWKRNSIWVTNLSQLYNWWVVRTQLNSKVEKITENRCFLIISNSSEFDAYNFDVYVDLNQIAKKIEISTDIIGQKLPQIKVMGNKILLRINKLANNTSLFYYIDIVN